MCLKIIYTIAFLLTLNLSKGQNALILDIDSKHESVRLPFPLLDYSNAFSPAEVYKKFTTSKGSFGDSLASNDKTRKSCWFLIEVYNLSETALWAMNIEIPRTNSLIVYKRDDSLNVFIELEKVLDKNVEIDNSNDKFATSDSIPTIQIDPEFSLDREPDSYSIDVKAERYEKTEILVKIDYPISFLPLSVVFERQMEKPSIPYDFLKAILIGWLIALILFFVTSKDMTYLITIALFIIESYWIYINSSLHLLDQFSSIIIWLNMLRSAVWSSFIPLILNVNFRNSRYLKYWCFIALLSFLTLISPNSLEVLTPPSVIILFFIGLDVATVYLLILMIRKKIKLDKASIAYYYLCFALIIPFFGSLTLFWPKFRQFAFSIPDFNNWFHLCSLSIYLTIVLVRYIGFFKDQRKRKLEAKINQQRELSEEVINALETERERIAKDLHDHLGNDLAVLKIKLQKLDVQRMEKRDAIALVNKAAVDLRNISHNLMPPDFHNTKLTTVLDSFFSSLTQAGNINFKFFSEGNGNHFSKTTELIIYRVLMEITNNVIRHSGATEAVVQLLYYDEQLEIMIEDDGKGFNFKNSKGFGLKSIQSRVKFMYGKVNIDSGQMGTTIIIEIPYPTP